MIAIIAGYAFLELDVGEVANQLRENGSTDIHPTIVPSPRRNVISAESTVFSSNHFSPKRLLFH
jgi:hypothetical protein